MHVQHYSVHHASFVQTFVLQFYIAGEYMIHYTLLFIQ